MSRQTYLRLEELERRDAPSGSGADLDCNPIHTTISAHLTSPTSTAQSKRPAHTGTTTAHSTTTAAAPTPTPQQVSKAKQALSQCQKENPGVTLKELEREAAGSHGIQC